MLHGRQDRTKHAIVRRAAIWKADLHCKLRRRRNAWRMYNRRSYSFSQTLIGAFQPALYKFKKEMVRHQQVRKLQHIIGFT